MHTNIAILGWGSLIWDVRPEFDQTHGKWLTDGPVVHLEFSRISSSRENSLTLVIDEKDGAACKVAYTQSSRFSLDEVVYDLRIRERTALENVGVYCRDGSITNSRSSHVLSAVSAWAEAKCVDVVIWTDLRSNFMEKSAAKSSYTVEAAMAHLDSLAPTAKIKAAEYIKHAPPFIDTKFRRAIQSAQWFKEATNQIGD